MAPVRNGRRHGKANSRGSASEFGQAKIPIIKTPIIVICRIVMSREDRASYSPGGDDPASSCAGKRAAQRTSRARNVVTLAKVQLTSK